MDRRDKITVMSYDMSWPDLFEQQRARLEPALRPRLVGSIEHIGSTSVPGLAAKPIIDMLARVDDYAAVAQAVGAVRAVGWVPAPEPSDEQQRRWSFCFPNVAHRSHHLHVVEHSSAGWPTWLAFRDHLRADPELAAEYSRIKTELAAVDSEDRPAYRAGKAPFIERVLAGLAANPS